MERVPDHPVIRHLLQTGLPTGREPVSPRCPVCGEECRTVYLSLQGEIFACDDCVTTRRAWERSECLPEDFPGCVS